MKKIIAVAKAYGPSIIGLALPLVTFAQNIPPVQQPTPVNVPQGNIQSLNGILQSLCTVFSYGFWFLIVLAVIFVIIAAFRYLAAAGNPENVKAAGTTLLYA